MYIRLKFVLSFLLLVLICPICFFIGAFIGFHLLPFMVFPYILLHYYPLLGTLFAGGWCILTGFLGLHYGYQYFDSFLST